jgi:hypothetical protein
MDGNKGDQELSLARNRPYGRHSWQWHKPCTECGALQTITLAIDLSGDGIAAEFIAEGCGAAKDPAVSARDTDCGREGGAVDRERYMSLRDIGTLIGSQANRITKTPEWYHNNHLADNVERLNQAAALIYQCIGDDTNPTTD